MRGLSFLRNTGLPAELTESRISQEQEQEPWNIDVVDPGHGAFLSDQTKPEFRQKAWPVLARTPSCAHSKQWITRHDSSK